MIVRDRRALRFTLLQAVSGGVEAVGTIDVCHVVLVRPICKSLCETKALALDQQIVRACDCSAFDRS